MRSFLVHSSTQKYTAHTYCTYTNTHTHFYCPPIVIGANIFSLACWEKDSLSLTIKEDLYSVLSLTCRLAFCFSTYPYPESWGFFKQILIFSHYKSNSGYKLCQHVCLWPLIQYSIELLLTNTIRNFQDSWLHRKILPESFPICHSSQTFRRPHTHTHTHINIFTVSLIAII